MNKKQAFIFFGIVGSGKGTQIELLKNSLQKKQNDISFVFASPGEGYRKLINENYYTGMIVRETLEKGYLQPDFLTNGLVVNNIAFNITENSCLIADGYPRTINQSKLLEEIFSYYEISNIHIVYIEVTKEEAIKRMKLRARSDDTDIGIAKRFDEYVNNVIPSMDYFKGKAGYEIHVINGEQTIENVHNDIINSLKI